MRTYHGSTIIWSKRVICLEVREGSDHPVKIWVTANQLEAFLKISLNIQKFEFFWNLGSIKIRFFLVDLLCPCLKTSVPFCSIAAGFDFAPTDSFCSSGIYAFLEHFFGPFFHIQNKRVRSAFWIFSRLILESVKNELPENAPPHAPREIHRCRGVS